MENINKLMNSNITTSLNNSNVIEVIAGESNGSIIVLKTAKEHREFSLFVYCTWRLENESEIITGSNEPSDGNLLKIKTLIGEKILDVKQNRFNDLSIQFESKKVLSIFCSITGNVNWQDYTENWTFCDIEQNKCFHADNKNIIRTSEYE